MVLWRDLISQHKASFLNICRNKQVFLSWLVGTKGLSLGPKGQKYFHCVSYVYIVMHPSCYLLAE